MRSLAQPSPPENIFKGIEERPDMNLGYGVSGFLDNAGYTAAGLGQLCCGNGNHALPERYRCRIKNFDAAFPVNHIARLNSRLIDTAEF